MTDYSYFSSDYFQDGRKCGTAYSNYKESVRTSPIYRGIAETLFKIFAPKRTLEIGCATGVIVKYLNAMGVDAWGIDVSEWAVSNAEHRNVLLAGAENLPFDDGEFDLVFSIHSLEHIPAHLADRAFEEIRRVSSKHQLHMLPIVGMAPYDGPAEEVIACLKKDPTHSLLHDRDWWINKLSAADFTDTGARILWPADTNNFELATCQILLGKNLPTELIGTIEAHNVEIAKSLHSRIICLEEEKEHRDGSKPLIQVRSGANYFERYSPELKLEGQWADLVMHLSPSMDLSDATFHLLVRAQSEQSDTLPMRIAMLSDGGNPPSVLEKWFSTERGFSVIKFETKDLARLSGTPDLTKIEKIYFGGCVEKASFQIALAVQDRFMPGWQIN